MAGKGRLGGVVGRHVCLGEGGGVELAKNKLILC